MESDQSDKTNVGDGTKSNVLESDQSDLESDQSNTTNAGNETKVKTGCTTQSKQHPRDINRNGGKPPVKPKGGSSVSPDQTKWTTVVKRGRRGNGRSMSLLNQ